MWVCGGPVEPYWVTKVLISLGRVLPESFPWVLWTRTFHVSLFNPKWDTMNGHILNLKPLSLFNILISISHSKWIHIRLWLYKIPSLILTFQFTKAFSMLFSARHCKKMTFPRRKISEKGKKTHPTNKPSNPTPTLVLFINFHFFKKTCSPLLN